MRINCPFNLKTQLNEYLAWLDGYKAGIKKANEIWKEELKGEL